MPRDIRIGRVKGRSYQRFGGRMLPGGDLHRQEEAFFNFVASRPEDTAEKWVKALTCPVIRVDGTRPVEENAAFIVAQLRD